VLLRGLTLGVGSTQLIAVGYLAVMGRGALWLSTLGLGSADALKVSPQLSSTYRAHVRVAVPGSGATGGSFV